MGNQNILQYDDFWFSITLLYFNISGYKMNNFVCVCTGTKYGTQYVDKLYNMATRHATDFKFHVITDVKKNWRAEINQIVVDPIYPTWWNKIHMPFLGL